MASEHTDGEGGVILGMLWAGTIELLGVALIYLTYRAGCLAYAWWIA